MLPVVIIPRTLSPGGLGLVFAVWRMEPKVLHCWATYWAIPWVCGVVGQLEGITAWTKSAVCGSGKQTPGGGRSVQCPPSQSLGPSHRQNSDFRILPELAAVGIVLSVWGD